MFVFSVMSSYFVVDFDFLSTKYNTIPITISAIAIIIGFVKVSSKNLSKTNPIIPPGIVARTMYQNILHSTVFFFLTT